MEPFPNLNSVFGMILQHESLNGLDVTENSEVMVNLSDGKKPTVYGKGKGNSSTKPCSYCNRTVTLWIHVTESMATLRASDFAMVLHLLST